MINTVNIKQQQLKRGYFSIGSGSELVLIMGSCRVAPYVNYFNDWNEANGNRFTICTLDPFNWNWNEKDERVDYAEALGKQENNNGLLHILSACSIFIHEYYSNAGMFNCDKKHPNNIYQYGLIPAIDICIPNFNDLFILVGDIVTFDAEIRKKAIQDYNVIGKLSEATMNEISVISVRNLNKFYSVCALSSIPEMADYFRENYFKTRFFWNYNHVTKWFTLAIFHYMNDLFLHLDLRVGFDENHVDMFANNYTYLTEYDPLEWDEEIKPLKEKL